MVNPSFMIILLGLLGLVLGSFAGAQVWRLRAKQLAEDKEYGEAYDKKEYDHLVKLTKHHGADDRSRCLACGHVLAWYDLIPLVSWMSTGGKCRYCRKKIGTFEPLIELGMATFLIVSYLAWPSSLFTGDLLMNIHFVFWCVAGILLAILFAYDLKWSLLPDVIVFPLMFVAGVVAETILAQRSGVTGGILSLDGAILILSGIYFAIYLVGERLGRRWIGFGDVKLGLVLALLLADWRLALLALFLANLIGCCVIIPLMVSKKITRQTQVPFGPFLIIGCVIAALWGQAIIDWYLSIALVI